MSSKKASTKESKTAAKKPAAKPAAKAAAKPAKVAEKKTAAKAKAPEKKPAAKTATASAAKKPAPKAAAKETKVTDKKSKPVAKATPAKAAPAKAAKVTKDVKPSKAAPTKAAPKAEAKVEKKPSAKSAPVKAAPAKAEKTAKEDTKASKAPVKVEPAVKKTAEKVVEKNNDKAAATIAKDNAKKNDYDYAVLLEGVKKLSKSIMFFEVDEQDDRANKKKMSSEMKNLEMKPTASIRRKSSLAEETQEELTERILKELEEQNLAFEREAATQVCTRCNRNLVSPEFWVDKHLGYCEECAMILKLGQSKEARKVEYQLGAMGGDSLDEEDDEIIGPDADDLKEAEEDLAEMDD